MTISVQMCGFEASQLADLRANFRVFVDTKYRELPGAFRSSDLHNYDSLDVIARAPLVLSALKDDGKQMVRVICGTFMFLCSLVDIRAQGTQL